MLSSIGRHRSNQPVNPTSGKWGQNIVFLLVVTAMFFLYSAQTRADLGDRGGMDSACQSSSVELKKLCDIVDGHFGARQDGYIHLGGEYYLVGASNTGRVAQGLYVTNIRTGQMAMYGGYGSPDLGKVRRLKDGTLVIYSKKMSMSHGHYWESGEFLHVMTNPITMAPYIVTQPVSLLFDASDDLQAFCMDVSNKENDECKMMFDWGKNHRVKVDVPSSKKIAKAHQLALAVYKGKIKANKMPYIMMEEAGVQRIINKKPEDITLHQYVNILNDYAFLSYGYGEGRNDLAVAVLKRVIELDPSRKVAYLNMAQALQNLAKWGASEYTSMPLGPDTIAKINTMAQEYMDKYRSM